MSIILIKAPEKCIHLCFERLLRGREKGELDEEVTVHWLIKQDWYQ
ncbi:MAG: hypothetical protein P8175_03610 [Deltaproteobacteria bacterium]